MQGNFTGIKDEISYYGILGIHRSETDKKVLQRYQICIIIIGLAIILTPICWCCCPISGRILSFLMIVALGIAIYFESRKRTLSDYKVIKRRYSQYLPQEGLPERGCKLSKRITEILNEIRIDNFDRYCIAINYNYTITLGDIAKRIREKTALWNKIRPYRSVAIAGGTSIVMLLSSVVDYYLNNETFKDTFVSHLKHLIIIAFLACFFAYFIDMFRMGLKEKKEHPYKDLQSVINAKIDRLIGKQK